MAIARPDGETVFEGAFKIPIYHSNSSGSRSGNPFSSFIYPLHQLSRVYSNTRDRKICRFQ